MTTITLPPLPPYVGFYPQTNVPVWTERMLRARDLEVARLVMENAAKVAELSHPDDWAFIGATLRNLEVKHHE